MSTNPDNLKYFNECLKSLYPQAMARIDEVAGVTDFAENQDAVPPDSYLVVLLALDSEIARAERDERRKELSAA